MEVLSTTQRQIVSFPREQGHMLVLAAPGSGKTLTIVERVGELLARRLIEPEQVLVMTFTTRAAAELVERLHARLDTHSQGLWAGTFHSICDRLLREHGHVIGWAPPYIICDRQQQEVLLLRASAKVGWDLALPHDVSDLRNNISSRKRLGLEAGQQRRHEPYDPDILLEIDAAYRGLLEDMHALDYDDLILKGVQLLYDDHETATLVRNRFQYLFVDEFHDVSAEQYALMKALCPPRSPEQVVMVVADPNQAIFGWRDADARRTLASYGRDYRPRRFTLAENYRSTGNLVRAAHQVITAGGATARSLAVHADHYPIYCRGFPNDEAEADWLAHQIQRACANGGYTYGDIAVLYRVHARANVAEASLLRHHIPISRVQPDRFFDQPDVQAALRYLALIAALHDESFEPRAQLAARPCGRVDDDSLAPACCRRGFDRKSVGERDRCIRRHDQPIDSCQRSGVP